jgi:hypothetical protein
MAVTPGSGPGDRGSNPCPAVRIPVIPGAGRPWSAAATGAGAGRSAAELLSAALRLLGIPIESPPALANRAISDLAAIARAARSTPAQLDRLLTLGEELVAIGRGVLDFAERLDQRAETVIALADRLDRRADAILALGDQLDARGADLVEMGARMRDAGERVEERGAEIVDRASKVVETGSELIAVLPTLERALEMATPLEGAIDRFGRLVDRLPGGQARRRLAQATDPTEAEPEP